MGFVVNQFEANAGDRAGTVYEITITEGTDRAEVWPMWGFNCLRWQVKMPDGSWGDILYTAPDWETNPVPTRSGHPILFPFPGRLRAGRFTFEGKTYQLPLNDSVKQNAIHGFTPRNPWQFCGEGTPPTWAMVAGAFSLRDDLPSAIGQWPSPFQIAVFYFLEHNRLRVNAYVENVGTEPLPFGLGYHPYFRLPGVSDSDIGGYVLQANVSQLWQADADNLPTGVRKPLPPALDFRQPRPIGDTALDHVFTGVTTDLPPVGGFRELAVLSHPQATRRLRLFADASFRELVLFTPPHRRAVAIEPYTCSADAANLAARGIDSGWQVLDPGQNWQSLVEYRWEPA